MMINFTYGLVKIDYFRLNIEYLRNLAVLFNADMKMIKYLQCSIYNSQSSIIYGPAFDTCYLREDTGYCLKKLTIFD